MLDDIYQAFDGTHTLGRHAAQMIVLSVQPSPSFAVISADEGVERAMDPQKEQHEFALLGGRVETTCALPTRDRGFACPDHRRELFIPQSEPLGGCQRCARENSPRIRLHSGSTKRPWVQLKEYSKLLAYA
jgi:hypothetical protein